MVEYKCKKQRQVQNDPSFETYLVLRYLTLLILYTSLAIEVSHELCLPLLLTLIYFISGLFSFKF